MRLTIHHLLLGAAALAAAACGQGDQTDEMATPSVPQEQPQHIEIEAEGGRVRMTAKYPEALEQQLEVVREGPEQMRVGRSYDYTLTIRNAGDQAIEGLTVIERLPADVRILQMVDEAGGQANLIQQQAVDQAPQEQARRRGGDRLAAARTTEERRVQQQQQQEQVQQQTQQQGHQIRWQVGSLEPDAERRLQVAMVPQQTGTLEATTHFEFEDALRMTFEVVDPELQVDLVVVGPENEGQQRFFVCEQPRVLLRLSNRGTGETAPVAVDLRLPPSLRLAEGEADGEDEVAGLLRFDAIPAGESRTREIPLQIIEGGQVRIEAQVSGAGEEIAINQIELELIDPQVDFQVQAAEAVKVGEPVRFSATVENVGEGPVEDLVLQAGLGGLELVPDEDAQQSWEDGRLQIGNLKAGESRQLNVVAATPQEPGEIETTWQLDGRCLDVEPITRRITVEGVQALRVELIDTEDPIQVDGTTSYRLRLTNQGSARINQVSVAMNLPQELQVESFEGLTGEEQVQGMADGEWLLGQQLELEAGESHEWVVAARAVSSGRTQVEVSVSSSATREPVVEHESTTIQ